MEITLIILGVLMSMAVSLGVGSSTLAVANFFVALSDGTITPDERRLMGVTYTALRVAMVLLLVLVAANAALRIFLMTDIAWISQSEAELAILLTALYANAVLMTKRLMPMSVGPAIQAGTWYTLGMVTALASSATGPLSGTQFSILYATTLVIAYVAITILSRRFIPAKP